MEASKAVTNRFKCNCYMVMAVSDGQVLACSWVQMNNLIKVRLAIKSESRLRLNAGWTQ